MLLNQEGSGRVNLKPFSDQAIFRSKLVQLNQHSKPTLEEYNYEAAIIHVGINNILRCKNNEELDNLPTNMMKIDLSRMPSWETIYFIYNSSIIHHQN